VQFWSVRYAVWPETATGLIAEIAYREESDFARSAGYVETASAVEVFARASQASEPMLTRLPSRSSREA
jgi:hypothetical protein